MTLDNILKEIEKNRANAEMELTMEFPNTYGARLGIKRAACDNIDRLKEEYKEQLLKSTAFIVTTGSGKDTFSELASSDTFGCFSVNPETLFNEIAEDVSPPSVRPSLYGREGVRTLFSIAQNVLRDKATKIGIIDYPALAFNDKYNIGVASKEEFAQIMKSAIVDQVGSEIVGIYSINSIVNKAIEKKHSSRITPIVLGTSDEKFALSLLENLKKLKAKTFLVVAGKASKVIQGNPGAIVVKNVNEENVADALTTIKNKLV